MNKKFEWTDELLKEFAGRANYCGYHKLEYYHEEELARFKSSHSKEGVRDWEIFEFRYSDNPNNTLLLRENGLYYYASGMIRGDLDMLLKENKWIIQSVRRLSDGVVFSVSETIDSAYNGVFTIKSIYLTHKYGMLQISGNNGDGTPTQVIPIQSASKLPERKVLLITEDGVNIHNGENVWYCNIKEWHVNIILSLRDYRPETIYKYFSTKEKADEYLILNKSFFSIWDISMKINLSDIELNRLKEFAKILNLLNS